MHIISSRSPVFWVLLVILSSGGIAFTYKFFHRAFPIAAVDVKVDRTYVLDQARSLAQHYNWGPHNYRQATLFKVDADTKNYVELEAGGSQAFNMMITGTLYSPYTWLVRHFKEGETNETVVTFKPDGTPYAFVEKIAESEPGERLSPSNAQKRAEQRATEDWNIHLDDYDLIESSQEVRPNGRVDHVFVYERPHDVLGEAHYRLRLTVTGDKLTEVNHLMKLPEGFYLRYAEMRSANTTISTAAQIVVNILYLFLGCCIGLFILMRQNRVIWRPALLWALFLGLLHLILGINSLPVSWASSYDTALSTSTFLLTYSTSTFVSAFIMCIAFFLSFAAAESLSRKAFGDHIRFWSLWNPTVASSWAVLGRTLGGYVLVGFDLALIVATYLFTRTFFGWWVPSDTLIDPNILATYVPWLTPAARSLSAGFWEECLFRAVPLASMALIGQKLGKRRLFLIAGFVLQAIIFGAAHADYPTQPAYGRLVELIIPSFIFGGIYLAYGLLPSIISHFIFDLALMSIPLFISSASGILIHQGSIIFWGAIPLIVVLYFRYRIGSWRSLTPQDYNATWQPKPQEKKKRFATSQSTFTLTNKHLMIVIFLGISAAATWLLTTNFKQDAAPLRITRSQAITHARAALAHYNLDDSWYALPSVHETIDTNNRYVWQEGGPSFYKTLTETYYVPTPQWIIRFAKFSGKLEQRAEEYHVFVAADGTILRVTHRLPEEQEGASLTENEARTRAYEELSERFSLTKHDVEAVSATPQKHPHRLDWVFVFNNLKAPQLKDGNGQLRISITISGDQITDTRRFVHVPEVWERHDRNMHNLLVVIKYIGTFLFMMLAGLGALYALLSFNFSLRELFVFLILQLCISYASLFNAWPSVIARFSTSEPWLSQVFKVLASGSMSAIIVATIVALAISMLYKERVHLASARPRSLHIIPASVVGILFAALGSLVKTLGPSLSPTWASYGAAGTYLPFLQPTLSALSTFLFLVAIFSVLLVFLNKLVVSSTVYNVISSLIFILTGLAMTSGSVESISLWFLKGIALGIILLLYHRTLLTSLPSLIVITLGTTTCFPLLQQLVFAAYHGAIIGNVLSVLSVLGLSWYLYTSLQE